MPSNTKRYAIAVVAALVPAMAALAEIQPQTANGVTYVTGGVGDVEQQQMSALRSRYPLRLLFAVQGSGNYLSDVAIAVSDRQGRNVFSTSADGPFLYIDLPAGTYRVTATSNGQAQTRSITVPASGGVEERFYWPAVR